MFASIQKTALFVSILMAGMHCPSALGGTLLKVHITGNVVDLDAGLGAQFSLGDSLSLDYSFDTSAADKLPNNMSKGEYDLSSFEGTLGSYVFKAASSHALTFPQSNPFGDQLFVTSENFSVGADVAGAHLATAALGFRDFDMMFLNGDGLPFSAPDLSIMEYKQFALGFDTLTGDRILVRVDLDSTSIQEISDGSVPEPSSFMVVVGLCTMVLSNRRRHHRESV